MAKQIVYGDQARQSVLRGINQLADAVIRAIEERCAGSRPTPATKARLSCSA
jgi:hypothetical protein